jgi:hypothetical protein
MNNYLRSIVVFAALGMPAAVLAQELVLFSGKDFKGRNVTLHKDAGNFERLGFNDQVSSLRVRHGKWELCTDRDFGGHCRVFEPGDYSSLGRDNNVYSSARPFHARGGKRDKQPRIVLFQGANQTGRSLELDGRVDNFERIGFNDRVQSIVVEHGHWRLCSDSEGRGECREFGPGRHAMPPALRSRVSSAYPR